MAISVNTHAGVSGVFGGQQAAADTAAHSRRGTETGKAANNLREATAISAIAVGMNANLAGLHAAEASINRALSVLDQATASTMAASDLLGRMERLAITATDQGLDDVSRASLNHEFVILRSQLSSIVRKATFGGQGLLSRAAMAVSADTDPPRGPVP